MEVMNISFQSSSQAYKDASPTETVKRIKKILKDNGIECCCSHEFNSKKAKRYDFRDINVHLEKREGNKSDRYWIEISNKDSNSGLFSKSFKMDVKYERHGKYWEEFLIWYIWQCCGGRKHGKHA